MKGFDITMSNELKYIIKFNECAAGIYNYYKILPSFLIGYSSYITKYGNSNIYKMATNAFNLLADNNWINNEGNYLVYEEKQYKKYNSLSESIIDFCENFKSKFAYLSLEEIYNVINSQIQNNTVCDETQKIIQKYNLTRYDTLITKTKDNYILHQLESGSTLKELANIYGSTVADIVRINEIKSLSELFAGKLIKIAVSNNVIY